MEFKWLFVQHLVLGGLHFAGPKAFALEVNFRAIVTPLPSIVLTPDIAPKE